MLDKKKRVGRPLNPYRKIAVSYRLDRKIVQALRESDQPASQIIEAAVHRYLQLYKVKK